MSFGMGKNLRYLKIRGRIVNTGEAEVDDPDIRLYLAVTIVDDDANAQEVHFRLMAIPRRLEERLVENDWTGTFYLLRYQNAQGLAGGLYAAQINGQKVYDPIEGWRALASLRGIGSVRGQLFSNALLLAFALCVVCVPLMLIVTAILPGGLSLLVTTALCGLYAYWLAFPVFRARKHLGFEQAEQQLRADGFDLAPALSPKH